MYLSGRLYQLSTTIEHVFSFAMRDYLELEKMNTSGSSRAKFLENTEKNITQKIKSISTKRVNGITSSDEYKIRPDVIRNAVSFCAISGRANIMRGIPYSATSISLYDGDGQQSDAVVFDVYRNTYYYAEAGKNSFTPKQKLRVSRNTSLEGAYVACDSSSYKMLYRHNCIPRITGSVLLDLAFLSAGKYDAVVYRDVEFSKFEAGLLMVKGAGGFTKYIQQENGKYTILGSCSIKIMSQMEYIFGIA